MMAGLSTYWHTLRHLRPVQFTARARHMLITPRLPDRATLANPRQRAIRQDFAQPITRKVSMLAPDRFVFLNQEGELRTASHWNAPEKPKLWLYNLHYFDDLLGAGADARREWHRALITRWIAENPPGRGNGWEPYPLSLRIVNWMKWSFAGNTLADDILASLQFQAHALARRIEWHLLGNHLLANAKALIFAGAFLSGPEAEALLARGTTIYRKQLDEQVLADGAHFELSPMYHAIILEDVLDLINLDRTFGGVIDTALVTRLREVASAMRRWLSIMSHPDGDIAFFNDGAFAIAATPHALESYAHRLGLPDRTNAPATRGDRAALTHLAASGYLRLSQPGAVALLDCAAIGPDYLPGHGHADTLSFEFSLGAERIIVNGGTSVYGTGADRLRQRSTAAHSTVEIDGQSSSEVWGGFRVARRARLIDLQTEAAPMPQVTASHDGYRRLTGRNVHTRTWRLAPDRLEVDDTVSGPYARAIARFHLHPGASLDIEPDARSGRIVTGSGRELRFVSLAPVCEQPSNWNPEFGKTCAASCLVLPLVNGASGLRLTW